MKFYIPLALIACLIYTFIPGNINLVSICMYRTCPVAQMVAYCYSRHNFTRVYEDAKCVNLENDTMLLRTVNALTMTDCVYRHRRKCSVQCSRMRLTELDVYPNANEIRRATADSQFNTTDVFKSLMKA